METTLYVYGRNLSVSGAGDASFNGEYHPGVFAPATPGLQWINEAGDRGIWHDGNTWIIGGNDGYASTSDTDGPWETTYITDGATSPAPSVSRIIVTIQDALDTLGFVVNVP